MSTFPSVLSPDDDELPPLKFDDMEEEEEQTAVQKFLFPDKSELPADFEVC